MAKRTRKMGNGGSSGSTSDMNDDMDDEEEKSPKRRTKKVMIEETFAKGGAVKGGMSRGCTSQVSGKKFSGTY